MYGENIYPNGQNVNSNTQNTTGNGQTTANGTGTYSGSYSGQGTDTYSSTGTNYSNSGANYSGTSYNYNYGTGSTDYQKKKKEKKPSNGFFKKFISVAVLGILFGAFAGFTMYGVVKLTMPDAIEQASQTAPASSSAIENSSKEIEKATTGVDTTSATTAPADTTAPVQTMDVSGVVNNVMPAVVSIVNNYTSTVQSFFGQSYVQEGQSSGSGIIVGQNDTELLIVTNYHVIEGNTSLEVTFTDNSTATAQVKGTDSDMDLAVIAVPLEKLTESTTNAISSAKLGDSDSLKVGEPAIAIGNALGYGQSVTTGVISAVNRALTTTDENGQTVTDDSKTFIQTDAAINPGNSGGALLNMNGEVIGINSNKIGGTTIEGMGYAIPISAAEPIIGDLMLKETKTKVATENTGYLGITGQNITADDIEKYGMPKGVYITQVYDGSAAANAGLLRGDIIVKLDDTNVTSMEELKEALTYYAAGTTVNVTIMQAYPTGYQSKEVQVTLGTKTQIVQ